MPSSPFPSPPQSVVGTQHLWKIQSKKRDGVPNHTFLRLPSFIVSPSPKQLLFTPMARVVTSLKKKTVWNNRIVVSSVLEKTFEITKSNHQCDYWVPSLNHIPQCHSHTAPKYLQGSGLRHFPGQPSPVLCRSLCVEILPYIQSKPVLASIFLHPIACHLRKETDTLCALTYFQAAVESDEVSPQLLLLL